MKYSFRPSPRSTPSRINKATRLRFAGRNTLKLLHRLPEPIEKIRLDEDDIPKKKKRYSLYTACSGIFRQLSSELSALAARIRSAAKKLFSFISLQLSKIKKKSFISLPMLSGAALACFLVCALTASYILLSLFAPYVRHYETVTVPAFRGKQLSEIEYPTDSFNLVIQYEDNPEIADGQIISQIPSAGVTRRLYGKTDCCDILLTVSKHDLGAVPTVTGLTLRNAALSLSNCGMDFTVYEEYSDTVKKGEVIRAYPPDGSPLERGRAVTLTVSLGKKAEALRVPSLLGLGESDAALRIRSLGLTLGEVIYISSSEPMGNVISQSPEAYTDVKKGTAVSLTVSAGRDFTLPTVPDLYGMSLAEAKERLARVGLNVSAVYSVSSAAPKGAIISQYPLPDTAITSAVTAVELYISN